MIAESVSKSETPPRTRRPWEPSNDEHSIHWWVKFQGRSQAEVANDYGIHQGTVSRIIERYERWQVRVNQQAQWRLTPDERLRAQRWLTIERNNKILASCLRIAEKTEGIIDLSRSTTQRPESYPSTPREVRSESVEIDRTGMVARFLRLAHKINTEQLKLVKEDCEPPLPPLSDEELEAELQAAAAAEAEIEAARREKRNLHEEEEQRQREHSAQVEAEMQAHADEIYRRLKAQEVAERRILAEAAEARDREAGAGDRESGVAVGRASEPQPAAATNVPSGETTLAPGCGQLRRPQPPDAAEDPRGDSPTPSGSALADSLDPPYEGDCAHKAHIAEAQETAATDDAACACDENGPTEENLKHARINGQAQPLPAGEPAVAELRLTPAEPAGSPS